MQGQMMRRVLEIGTGCGYQAAGLSLVAREVYRIERLRGWYNKARENLRPMRLPMDHEIFGAGMLGNAKGAPYTVTIAVATVKESYPKRVSGLVGCFLGLVGLLPVSSLAGKLGRSFMPSVRSNAAPMLQGCRVRLNPLAKA